MITTPLYVVANYFDAPQILDCTVTSIPGSASLPLQVVLKTVSLITQYKFNNTTNQYIGVYTGNAGSEVLVSIIDSSGNATVSCFIDPSSRVSLRSMSASAVTSGNVCCQFFTTKNGIL